MRIAVLVKQVPHPAELALVNGQLVRNGVQLETSAFCRRANARAVELAGPNDEVVVFTMGPSSAADSLREMIACGAHRGVLVSDVLIVGSDTLVTARVLAAAIRKEGPFDLVLTGAFTLDSETGHVGIQVAENLGLPFIGPCCALSLTDGVVLGTVEHEGGFLDVEVLLPAVASAAERLCAPSKASQERIDAVPAALISRVTAADLGLGPDDVGLGASPTVVGDVMRTVSARERQRLRTTSAGEALDMLDTLVGARGSAPPTLAPAPAPVAAPGRPSVWCIADPTAAESDMAFIAAVTSLASTAGRRTLAVVGTPGHPACGVVNEIIVLSGPTAPEDWVAVLAQRLAFEQPHALVIECTRWGREVCARLAARLGWGLVGDAVDLTLEEGRLLAWKSAFSGQAVVPISSRSPTLLVTARPGTLTGALPAARPSAMSIVETLSTATRTRVIYDVPRAVDSTARQLSRASCVVVVGVGVCPDYYPLVEELRGQLSAGPLGATRRVTDAGWLPRSRQIGITGRSVAPFLLVSIAASGRFNHAVGFRGASYVLAINHDPGAEIFDHADVGVVGDWRQVATELVSELRARETSLAVVSAQAGASRPARGETA